MTLVAVLSASGRLSGIGHRRRADRVAEAASRRSGITISRINLDGDPDAHMLLNALQSLEADVIVIDVPPSLQSDRLTCRLEVLKARGCFIIGVDGPVRGIDVLIVPSFVIDVELSRRHEESSLDVRWGWDHLLIDQRRNVAARLSESPVLVLTGGSDATGLGQTLPKLLDAQLELGTTVEWVVGPHAPEPDLPEDLRLDWRILRGHNDLRPLMERAGHALAVYGVTVLELLHHGVPTVALSPYGNRDVAELAVLEKECVALTATDGVRAVEILARLMSTVEAGNDLASRAAARIPESGVERVVNIFA